MRDTELDLEELQTNMKNNVGLDEFQEVEIRNKEAIRKIFEEEEEESVKFDLKSLKPEEGEDSFTYILTVSVITLVVLIIEYVLLNIVLRNHLMPTTVVQSLREIQILKSYARHGSLLITMFTLFLITLAIPTSGRKEKD